MFGDEHGGRPSLSKVHQSKIPNPVQEVSMEDEQSERGNISLQVVDGINQQPRSSVQSLINMMSPAAEVVA